MEIKVLGFGCAKCNKLYNNLLNAVKTLNISPTILKIEDAVEIASYNTFFMPVLLIDNKILSKGIVLSEKEIQKLITSYTK